MSLKSLSLMGLLAFTVVTLSACATTKQTDVETSTTPESTTTTTTTSATTATDTTAKAPATTDNANKTDVLPQKAGADVSKPVAGSPSTANLTNKGGVVKKDTAVDPYTGTADRNNYAGHHPIAKDQSVTDRVQTQVAETKAGKQ